MKNLEEEIADKDEKVNFVNEMKLLVKEDR